MGDYLSTPNKEKESFTGQNERVLNILRLKHLFISFIQFLYAGTGMQGWRKSMEDSHVAELNIIDGVAVFGVFDGHGGNTISHILSNIQVLKWQHL